MIEDSCNKRRAGLALSVLSGLVLVAGVLPLGASAGDYHSAETLRCDQCHVMHYSQGHGYNADGSGGYVAFSGFMPNRALLRHAVNDLCLACHDSSITATDVLTTNTGSQTGIVRLGGYLNRIGVSGQASIGHTLDALNHAPGSQPAWRPEDENGLGRGLTCINCHDPHGLPGAGHPTGSQYRNLRSDPGNMSQRWVTYNHTSPGSNDLSRDVFVRQALDYDESMVDWNEPDSTDSAIARWCGGCHSFIHDNSLGGSGGGGGGGGSPFMDEHPVFDENLERDMLTRYNGLTNRVKVMSEIGLWYPAGSDVTPTCVTCHRGHGNGNPDGLIYRSGTGTPTEDGDTNGSTVGDLCGQCHSDSMSEN